MNCRQRVEAVLTRRRPDRLPVAPIYDIGYVYSSLGCDVREYTTGTQAQRIEVIEQSFLRHDVDGLFVHKGADDTWRNEHAVEQHADYWLVTDLATGEKKRFLPDGCWAQADGTPIMCAPSAGGESKIRCTDNIEREMGPILQGADLEAAGWYGPLAHLAGKYPDHHFSFQMGTPMVHVLNGCGGYVEGLVLMKSDPDLFRQALQHAVQQQIARIPVARAAGGHSAWFTSYYTGADTISPRDYAELIFPYDLQVCQAVKEAGLFCLNWYLGDLMPVLDRVMELPLDALVLEQGRKGYDIDPAEIRRRVGDFCLFGFGFENDYCTFDRERLYGELKRQIAGAAVNGAYICGTPIMPPNAQPEAVDYYFEQARTIWDAEVGAG